MYKVRVKYMPMEEYLNLGYRAINHEGEEYRILCPNETDITVDIILHRWWKDKHCWGLKYGVNAKLAFPIYPPDMTHSEKMEDELDGY